MITSADVWYYYMGQQYRAVFNSGEIIEHFIEFTGCDVYIPTKGAHFHLDDKDLKSFKLILTHADDMSEAHKEEYYSLCKQIEDSNGKIYFTVDTPLSLEFLLRNGYDAFNLIENKQAYRKKML
jgi:hypothetical protein